MLRDAGRFEEAEALLLEAHAMLEEDRGPQDRLVGELAGALRALYEAWGRPDRAAAYTSEGPSTQGS